MAHDPDVLDHLGFVPRELGAVQVHFEPVQVVEAERRAYVTALLQPAFEGRLTGKLMPTALTALGDRAVAANLSVPLPALDRQVLRWRFSFPVLAVPDEILFRVEAPVPKDAERIRAAWKLLETVEQPKEVHRARAGVLEGSSTDMLGLGVHVALELAMGHLVIPDIGGSVASIEDPRVGPREIVRHAARESLEGTIVKAVQAPAAAGFREGVEVLWQPGMELPEPPPPAPVAAPAPARQQARSKRPCPHCGHDVDVAEAEKDRQCPWCGEPWLY